MPNDRLGMIFLTNSPQWWCPKKGQLFTVYQGENKVASYSYAIVSHQKSPRGKEQCFPDSWYVDSKRQEMLPILEITGLETISNKTKGYGRFILQHLYEISKSSGCAGRIQTMASFGAGSFYEHCGFDGKSKGMDELKYFHPSQENLLVLFSKRFNAENIRIIKKNSDGIMTKKYFSQFQR